MVASVTLITSVGVSFNCIRMLIGAFSIIYLLNKGVTINEIGWLKGFQGFILIFIDIPLSHAADRFSRKFSISLSIFFAAIWLLVTGISETFWGFLIAELFNALSLGLISGTFSAYLYDLSKHINQHKMAIEIFATYEKYSFFFMSIVSIIGAVMYQYQIGNIWIIASSLMVVVFFLSLYLPSDNQSKHIKTETLITSLKQIHYFFFNKTQKGYLLLYINLILAILSQILIQYWQLLTPKKYATDHIISLSVIFFFILNIQALSGFILERVKKISIINRLICYSLIFSLFSLILSYWSVFFIILAIISLFFNLSMLSSIYRAQMINEFTTDNRSTLLSCIAVLSKFGMFIFMPICAVIINISSFLLILFMILLLGMFYSNLIKNE